MSYSNGLLQNKETVVGRNGKDGKDGVGFKLTDSGDYDMDKKKIFGLKTPNDVAFDADYDSYAIDLSSGVNKGYLKLNCLTKDVAGNDFDANQATINNSAPYYDGLYQKTSLVSKEYVDLMETNLEQKIDSKIQNKADLDTHDEQTFNSIINVPKFDSGYSNMSNVMNKEYIDSRDALKADKTYSDNTFLTKKTGAILANTLQSKVSKIYADSTFLTKSVGNGLAQSIQNRLNIHGTNVMQANLDMNDNRITNLKPPLNDTDAVNKKYMLDHVGESHVQSANGENKFKYIMDDPNAQVSEENDVELGTIVTFQKSPHQVNKKVVDMKLLLDTSKGYFSSRIGLNLFKLTNDQYTAVLEIMWVSDDIDPDSLEIYGTSSIETIHNVSRKTFKTQKYVRLICQFTKSQSIGNNYLYLDLVMKNKTGSSYAPKLQTYFTVYGISGHQSNVEPSIYDQIYYIANDQINFNTAINMDNKAIYGIEEGNSDSQAVNYKQLNSFNDNLKAYLETKILSLQPKSYYNEVFEYFFDLLDPSNFIMADSNGAVVSSLANQPRVYKPRPPIPTPRKNVKQMIDDYEENVIQPPPEFRDDYKPKPMPRTIKTAPLPLPRTKIEEVAKAMKGYTKSFEIAIKNNKDPLLQLQNTRKAVENHIIKELSAMKGVKFIETLKVKFTKMSGDSVIYKTAYFNSKAQTIINNLEIVESLQASKQQILNFVAQWISEGSGWTIESVDGHYINLVKYEPMKGESYIQLPPELRNSAKGLINMKNEDNECFRWCHIRYINPQDKYPQRIKKSDKAYVEKLNYDGINFPVNIKQFNKIEKQNEININVFGYEDKKPYPIFISKENFQFMSSSLEKLVSNLPKESLKYTSEIFESKQLNLMSRKGIYPYDYMDSFDKFNEKLPKKEDFYSILNDEHISDDDYKHAKNVWKTFKIKNMGEYHDLYLKSDVLLLADVFESFRKTCLKYYKLDPCHYFSSPGLSWDSMLKMTDIKLELMTDIDMYQFIEKGMRGGISYIANRYGKANNKYMKDYDEKAPSKYIMYLDANNLYGWAMSQFLPTGGFRWLTEKQINKANLAKYKENSKKGLILEVDLEYPNELHDRHNDYPLGAEKLKVTKGCYQIIVKKLLRNITYQQMNWKEYLEQLLFPVTGIHVTDEEHVVVYGVDYLKNITNLLKETSNRTIANYMMWRLVDSTYLRLGEEFEEIFKNFYISLDDYWAKELTDDIREAFEQNILELDWMDDKTKSVAIRKVRSMVENIGFPDYIVDDKMIDEKYKNI
ncbi:hypothetical protein ACROYT_G022435 [Oculina patagonica]